MKNEKKAWVILFVFLILIGLLIGITNMCVDCANQIRSSNENEEMIANALINGKTVYFPTHPNERIIKEELVKKMPSHTKAVAFGSSLIMTLNKDILGLQDGDFYNLGVSGANIKDYLNFLGMMKVYEKKADTFIFLLQTNAFLSNLDTRNILQKQYGDYYVNYLNGADKNTYSDFNMNRTLESISAIFSISYFQDNLSFLKYNDLSKRFIIGEIHPEYAHYMSDGSWVYNVKTQSKTKRDVLADAKNNGKAFMPTESIDSNNVDMFDKIIRNLLQQGKKIVLYFPPYAPSLYDLYPIDNSPCFMELEKYISRYKTEKNVLILGSFYPEKLGMDDSDFYDARHVRRESMSKAFQKVID